MIFRDIELGDREWLDKKFKEDNKKHVNFVLPTIICGENIFQLR